MAPTIQLKRVSGQALADCINDVARLRIEVFREFPYPYEGTLDYEQKYLKTYTDCAHAVAVLALDHGKVVGASTAIPMAHETPEFQAPMKAAGYDLSKVFYCAESVLLPSYRGLGLGWAFFDEREAHAAELGGFEVSCFCAVDRPDDHPLKPANAKTRDSLWRKRGYRPLDVRATYRWKDIDQPEETEKTLRYWARELAH